jgi:hypothetical protein
MQNGEIKHSCLDGGSFSIAVIYFNRNSPFSLGDIDMAQLKKWTIRISMVLLIALLVFLAGIELLIGWGLRTSIQKAKKHFPGDRVAALIAVVECDSCDLRERDSAVWALGQLADKRALPVLVKFNTGKPCNHLSRICQYELSQALRTARSGNCIHSLFWRWMLPV